MEISKPQKNPREKYEHYYLNIPKTINKYYYKKYKITVPVRYINRISLDSIFGQSYSDALNDRKAEELGMTRAEYLIKQGGRKPTTAYRLLSLGELRRVTYNYKKLLNPKELVKQMRKSNAYRDNIALISIEQELIEAIETRSEQNDT